MTSTTERRAAPRTARRRYGGAQGTAALITLSAFALFVVPWAVGYPPGESGGDAYLNDVVVGILVLYCGLDLLLRPQRSSPRVSAAVTLLGAWLIIAPVIWGYGDAPYVAEGAPKTQWAMGSLIVVLGLANLLWKQFARNATGPGTAHAVGSP